jgi:hypothetical protein
MIVLSADAVWSIRRPRWTSFHWRAGCVRRFGRATRASPATLDPGARDSAALLGRSDVEWLGVPSTPARRDERIVVGGADTTE